MKMKMKLKMKNRSLRHDIYRPRPRHGHKYTNCKVSQHIDAYIATPKQRLTHSSCKSYATLRLS